MSPSLVLLFVQSRFVPNVNSQPRPPEVHSATYYFILRTLVCGHLIFSFCSGALSADVLPPALTVSGKLGVSRQILTEI